MHGIRNEKITRLAGQGLPRRGYSAPIRGQGVTARLITRRLPNIRAAGAVTR